VPNEACARSTASHSRRSATTLASGDQIATISSLAYRLASTLGIVTDTQLTARVRQARPMYFVGLDLAWGEKNHTGVAAIDSDGRLMHVGVAQDDASIEAAVAPYVDDECLVAIDAPLIVNNPTGYRLCETALNRDFQRFEAGARPAYTDKPEFKDPRATRIATALGLDMDPTSSGDRRAIEVYPHPATIVLFGLEKTLKYKRGAFEDRQRELLRLMTLIEGLDKATPRLRVNHNVAWVELHKRVEAATRPSQLDRDEDPVDAVVCAYVALYWYHRPEDVTIYGDFSTGYIVTPTLAGQVAPQPDAPNVVNERLTRLAVLLQQAQLELTEIRRRLG
jgi:predicted RNase H-like nuclease